MKIIHVIEETTCTSTWLKACELLAGQEDKTLYTLILGVHEPAVVTSEEFRMHDVLNEFLVSKDQLPLSSIANTLFPAGLYLQGGPDAVFREFPALYPKMREGWGTYAYRMLNPTIARDGVNLSACVFRSMWAGDSIGCGHLIPFDVVRHSVVMWAAFFVLP